MLGYQLPELVPSNSDSGLHSCISISIHTQHITSVAELIHYVQICTGTHIHTCMTCTDYRIRATSTNKWPHHFVHATLYTTTLLVYPLVTTRLVHFIELLPTPLPHTPHDHLAAFWRSPLIITLVFGRRFVKRFALCYRTIVRSVCLSVLSCLWRSCTVAKRLNGSTRNLACS